MSRASAPANARAGSVSDPNAAPVQSVAATAPTLAPELTPSRCGSASRLPVAACSVVPATASEAPTRVASSTRGRRISQTMSSCIAGAVVVPNRCASTTRAVIAGVTATGPSPVAITIEMRSSTVSIVMRRRVFWARCLRVMSAACIVRVVSITVRRRLAPRSCQTPADATPVRSSQLRRHCARQASLAS